jgi:hypothetical protein
VLEFVDIKVANRIDSFKVALLGLIQLKLQNLLMRIWEAAVWIYVWFVAILNFFFFFFLMYLLILISYFIGLAASLCCFESLVCYWRNWWVELYWYKIFLCGIEVFDCSWRFVDVEKFFLIDDSYLNVL